MSGVARVARVGTASRRRRLRRRHPPPYVIGLTGSIGMGKTTVAQMLRWLGVPVHDADAAVHRLMGRGGAAVAAVGAAFPGVVCAGAVDRARLGARVFEDRAALRRLEAILHPLVRAAARDFLRRAARRRHPVAVLDIPLLFETGGEALCDTVWVVSAPAFVQRARVLMRAGMTPARFAAIAAKQIPDVQKRRRADVVIRTGLSKRHTWRQVHSAVNRARRCARRLRNTALR
ncbi:MAG: dephospho-CoA kinase [Alphaproteobacteria bacterium]|nr:MAG: dephospho-CoA kinase [Alphaproteobacteria bacterium]